jgi:hypothetical protein
MSASPSARHKLALPGLLLLVLAAALSPLAVLERGALGPSAGSATIALNSAITYQTIVGWEAESQSGQIDSPRFPQYKDYLFDQAVNDLGINRVRLGTGPASPTSFNLASIDSQMLSVVLPLKQRLEARGEKLWINGIYTHDDRFGNTILQSANYARAVLALYRHMQQVYGIVPDSWEVGLEPGLFGWPSPHVYADAFVAAGDILARNGFTPYLVGPSSECGLGTALTFYSQAVAHNPRMRSAGYHKEFAYHNYCAPSDAEYQQLQDLARAANLRTAMLEHGGATYGELHNDLKKGGVSAWEQYTLAYPTDDNGYQYYWIDQGQATPSGMVNMGYRTRFLRQYFKFIRAGARRIDASTTNSAFDPVAFVNADGKWVVVVKVSTGGTLDIQGLPAGTYGIKYTTDSQYDVDVADVTISGEQLVSATMPAAGVITIYAKTTSATQPPPQHSVGSASGLP